MTSCRVLCEPPGNIFELGAGSRFELRESRPESRKKGAARRSLIDRIRLPFALIEPHLEPPGEAKQAGKWQALVIL